MTEGKTEQELIDAIIRPLLQAATAFDFYGSALVDEEGSEDLTEWCYHNANALRDLANEVRPPVCDTPSNVVLLRAAGNAPVLPPERPRCRG